MTTFLNYFVPGITDGSVYALAALGLVLTYKTSGVFNFAHGAVAAAAAYLFYQGYVEWKWPWPLAFLFSLGIVGILGGLVMAQLGRLLSTAPTVDNNRPNCAITRPPRMPTMLRLNRKASGQGHFHST